MDPKRPFHISGFIWRDIRKRPFRNILAVCCFVILASSLFSTYYLVNGASESLNTGISRMGADMLVVPGEFIPEGEAVILTGQPSTFFFNATILDRVSRVEGVDAASPQLYIATLRNASCCSLPVELIGFDPKQDFTITPWLDSNLGHDLNKDEVVVGSRIQGEVGSALMFYGHNYTITGRLEPTGMGIDTSVFVRMEDAYHMASESEWKAEKKLELSPDVISSVLVRVSEGEDPEAVGARIQSVIPETRVITPNYLVNRVANQMSGAKGFLDGISLVIIIFSFPFVALISYMVANERKREISMIITMGGSKLFIFWLILAETMILALIGAAIGVIASSFIFYSFREFIALTLKIPYIWPSIPGVFIFGGAITAVAMIVGIVASLYPAFQASNIEPSEELWRGEF